MTYVQADPIRAPARAQDLVLRHRVRGYRAGDLERGYASLEIEEDFFVVYGFVSRSVRALMHPRSRWRSTWSPSIRKRAESLLAFVRERGVVHPREVDRHFAHGSVTNYWGGSSNATTHLLERMHYRGMLRVAARENGIRLYGVAESGSPPADRAGRHERLDRLVDAAVRLYAPLTSRGLSHLVVTRLGHAVPQWRGRELKNALARAKKRLAHARVEGREWFWPAEETPEGETPDRVRLLAPFDPLVWDRERFEIFWDWAYRFEAYTPAAKRKLGYYALPLLWRDRVIGWGNLAVKDGKLEAKLGYIGARPRDRAYKAELESELERMRSFLDL
ncbi:MAG TPA: crosslink repair DNA glycosylase YcaQ family protein [Candidatus Eisenbacteria bacterium]|nr:crosslink repair DNA glycosylase YcaQ family protein [Candidatus Eisenbacteria bacterium]